MEDEVKNFHSRFGFDLESTGFRRTGNRPSDAERRNSKEIMRQRKRKTKKYEGREENKEQK